MIKQFKSTTFLGGAFVQPKISRKENLSGERQRPLRHLQRQHLRPAHLQHFHLIAQRQFRESWNLLCPTGEKKIPIRQSLLGC